MGTETITKVSTPFRTMAPPWYNNGVWGTLGCAVPQPGTQFHTNNLKIWEFVDIVGRQLFQTFWSYPDRLLERAPSKECLWEIYQLVNICRNRLAAGSVQANQIALRPTKATPAPQMFRVYPVPLYGSYGCVNIFMYETLQLGLLMCTEAMNHSDNIESFFYTQKFYDAVGPYLQSVLISMGSRFFGAKQADLIAPTFDITADMWAKYSPDQFAVPVEATAVRPPIGLMPTSDDLNPIRGLPVDSVIGFLQPWPSTVLEYSSGGTWAQPGSPADTQPSVTAGPTPTGQPAFPQPVGPPPPSPVSPSTPSASASAGAAAA